MPQLLVCSCGWHWCCGTLLSWMTHIPWTGSLLGLALPIPWMKNSGVRTREPLVSHGRTTPNMLRGWEMVPVLFSALSFPGLKGSLRTLSLPTQASDRHSELSLPHATLLCLWHLCIIDGWCCDQGLSASFQRSKDRSPSVVAPHISLLVFQLSHLTHWGFLIFSLPKSYFSYK